MKYTALPIFASCLSLFAQEGNVSLQDNSIDSQEEGIEFLSVELEPEYFSDESLGIKEDPFLQNHDQFYLDEEQMITISDQDDVKYPFSESRKPRDARYLCLQIQKLILLGSDADPNAPRKRESSFEAIGLSLTSAQAKKLKSRLEKIYLDRPFLESMLVDMKREIIDFYSSLNRPVVFVDVPQQELTNGVLVIQVIEGKVGKVSIRGNKYFDISRYRKSIRICEGETLRSDLLAADLYWLNNNPFREVNAVYSAGNNQGETDVELIVRDERPFRLYSGIDNTGFQINDYIRIFAGIISGNLFHADQQFTYQFTTAPSPGKFMSHTASWTFPLPWRHIVNIFGGYSSVTTHLVPSVLVSSGFAGQASFRYQIPFFKNNPLLDDFFFGADFKRTNNTVVFGGDEVLNKGVDILQFMVRFSLTRERARSRMAFTCDIYGQPGPWLPDMQKGRYEAMREFASNRYIYGRARLLSMYRFGKVNESACIENLIEGQLSSSNLLPSEQYGLGGYGTVRGFVERAINVDNALICSTNFYAPPIHLYRPRCPSKFNDQLAFLAFVDMGMGIQHRNTLTDDRKIYFLAAAGPGLRYHFGHWLTCRFDWGIKINRIPEDTLWSRISFSATGAF